MFKRHLSGSADSPCRKQLNAGEEFPCSGRFFSRLTVLDYGQNATAYYGKISADLERKGTPIGVNDLHIAGYARCEGFTLVTNNVKEFERVEGLRLNNRVQ